MLTAKNHTGGGYRTDDGYVFSPGDVISDTGDGFCAPWWSFHYIPKSALSAGELAAALSVLGGQAGHQAGNSHLAGASTEQGHGTSDQASPSLGKQASNQPSASPTNTQTTPTTSKPATSKPSQP